MGVTAQAAQVGNAMDYTRVTVITGIASPDYGGSGFGTGTGIFDSSGELTVAVSTTTSIPSLGTPSTVVSSILYSGSISGNTLTYNGTHQETIVSCTGNGTVCANIIGTGTPSIGNAAFTLDILNGGTWETASVVSPLAEISVDHTLSPVPLPPTLATPVPTVSAYGLALIVMGLLIVAWRRLRTRRQA